MKIVGTRTENVEIEIDVIQLSYAIMERVLGACGYERDFDDGGMDWLTYGDYTYIGNKDWKVSDNRSIARLVDAANILRCGKELHL